MKAKYSKTFHVSYKTHNYCVACSEYTLKSEWDGIYCRKCSFKLRKRARYVANKEAKRY